MSATAEARSWPNGFSITTRRWRPSDSRTSPAAAKSLDDAAEEAGRGREIEHDVGAGLVAELAAAGRPVAGKSPGPRTRRPDSSVARLSQAQARRRRHRSRTSCFCLPTKLGRFRQTRCGNRPRQAPMVDAEHGEVLVQQPGYRQIVEGWQQQPAGQVAAGTEDHQHAGRRRLGGGRVELGAPALAAATSLSLRLGRSTWPPNLKRMAESRRSPKV